MPKEVIYAEDYGRNDEHRQTEVRWNRNGWVELATVSNLEPATEGKVEGVFLSLDRHGLNHLIRTARKARDQAFGADA